MSEIQISKTLLILKSSAVSTTAAEQFLRNREWVVFSTTNLKDFLTYIIQKKPSFVMISVDHPNKKVLMMPKVLGQSFPVCVFTFAEQSSSISFRKLQDVQCLYKINPPATGPAIERTVNKYLRDQEKKLREQNATGDERAQGDAISGKPGDSNAKVSVIQSGISGDDTAGGLSTSSGGAWSQAASVFSQLLEGDDSAKVEKGGLLGDQQVASSGTPSGAGIIMAKGEKAAGSSWVPLEGTPNGGKPRGVSGVNGDTSGFINGVDSGFNGSGAIGGEGRSDAKDSEGTLAGHSGPAQAGFVEGQSGEQAGGVLGRIGRDIPGEFQSSDSPGNTVSSSGIHRKKESTGAGSAAYDEDDVEGSEQLRALQKDPKSLHSGKDKNSSKESTSAGAAENSSAGRLDRTKRYEKESKIITVMGRNSNSPLESIILKGTKQALDETVEVLDGEVNQELEDSSQVACIVVESEKFNGYLIAALGKNRKMDGKFIKAIQDRLFKFLKDNGENVSDKDNMNLKIKKVEFEDWAVEYADFLKKSVHNGEEIAMAFFPVSNVRPEIGESASSTMASVKLSEMESDKTVEFNMYVYLPANKKYILYTPKGGKFYGNQKGRLEEKGVKEVHMLKSEVNDLSKYKAQNYLNNLIDTFKKKKSGTPSAAA